MKTIKLIRFMSDEELQKFLKFEELENHTDFSKGISKSGSKGFCFFPYGDGNDDAEQITEYTSGILTMQRVAIFETERRNVHKSFGYYRDVEADKNNSLFDILSDSVLVPVTRKTEYCTEHYNRNAFKLLNVGAPYRNTDLTMSIRWFDGWA